jgi:hypothetical protein
MPILSAEIVKVKNGKTMYFVYTCFNTEYGDCEGTEEEPFTFLLPTDDGNERTFSDDDRQCPSCGNVCEEGELICDEDSLSNLSVGSSGGGASPGSPSGDAPSGTNIQSAPLGTNMMKAHHFGRGMVASGQLFPFGRSRKLIRSLQFEECAPDMEAATNSAFDHAKRLHPIMIRGDQIIVLDRRENGVSSFGDCFAHPSSDKDDPRKGYGCIHLGVANRGMFLHELGHVIDQSVQYRGGHATEDPVWRDWNVTVRSSQTYQNLQSSRDAESSGVRLEERARMLGANELWARSYAQWVCLRSGDTALLSEYKQLETEILEAEYQKLLGGMPFHNTNRWWPLDDFEPIAKAIDCLLARVTASS